MSLDATQLRVYVIRPALVTLGLHSVAAEQLVLGTALQESRLRYLDQLSPGPGPAYGLWQIEKATHADLYGWVMEGGGIEYRTSVTRALAMSPTALEQLRTNLIYGAMMCRLYYKRVPAPLPPEGDIQAAARYWKEHYNTHKGKGTPAQYAFHAAPAYA